MMAALSPEKLAEIKARDIDSLSGDAPYNADVWTLNSWVDLLLAEVERLNGELENETQFHIGVRLDVEKVLDKALGPNEGDGAGGGLAADVALLADQLSEARAEAERLQKELNTLTTIREIWIEGVTPTGAICNHGVVVMRGTYLRDQVPTGDHPECAERIAEELASYEADGGEVS